MAQNYLTDAAIRQVVATVHGFERMIRNLDRRVGELSRRETRPGARPVWFRNHSGETIPPNSIVASDGIEQVEGVSGGVLKGVKPSTTFRDEYFATGDREVPPDGVAKIQHAPRFRLAYDTGTPAEREGWGPKPGQWTLAKGFPCTTKVLGVIDSDKKLLLGTLTPVSTLLCQATGDLDRGVVGTGDYVIWKGTIADGEDAGFTTLPDIELEQDVDEDAFFVAHWVNNGWVVPAGGGEGGGTRRFMANLTDPLTGSTASVTGVLAFDGRDPPEGLTSVDNPLNYRGRSGAVVFFEEFEGEEETSYLIYAIQHVDLDLVSDVIHGAGLSQDKYAVAAQTADDDPTNEEVVPYTDCNEEEPE